MMTTSVDYRYKWRVFAGIALLTFGCYLDYTVVNVALPTIQRELHANLAEVQWVMNIYFLALCVLAAIMGSCGDLFGRRRCFYLGTGIFAIASLLAGCATTIHLLIVGRLLQGVGAAIVFPVGASLLPEAFPPEERAKAIAGLGSLGGIALALGPVVGGIIVTHWGWRWIFFINIPIIILGFLLCARVVRESARVGSGAGLDWQGMLLLAFTMSGLVLGLLQAQAAGWTAPLTLIYLIVGVGASLLLFKIEKNKPHPLIDFKDFKKLPFYAGAALCFLAGVMSAVALFFDPLYLQIIRNESVQVSGWVLFAIPIAVFVGTFGVAGGIRRFGMLAMLSLGLLLAVFAGLLAAFFTVFTPLWYVTLAFVLLGGTWALGNTAPIIAAQQAVSAERTSVATGAMIIMFNMGGSIGLALAVVIYQLSVTNAYQRLVQAANTHLTLVQWEQVKTLLPNPAHALQTAFNSVQHTFFNDLVMQGFSNVMWFLCALATALFLSVLVWALLKSTPGS